MKKIIMSSFILILTVCIMGNVYGAFSCQINMEAPKTQVSKNDEFTVDVKITNIQSEKGVISFGGTLEYDKDSLTLVKMEGQNGWETPSHGSTFNKENGKIGITRNGVGKNNETIFKMTFQVKEASRQNLVVSLKDMVISDGTVPFKISNVSQTINVTEKIQNSNANVENNKKQPESSKTPNVNTNSNSNITTKTSSKGNTKTTTKTTESASSIGKIGDSTSSKATYLPKAGESNYRYIFMMMIGLVVVVAGIFFFKMRILNKEMKR